MFAEVELDRVADPGPRMPPEWVPALEQPARPRPAPPLAVAGVVLGIVLALAAIAFGLWKWYAGSVVTTALAGVEAALTGDPAALEPLLMAETVSSPQFRAARATASRDASITFSDPQWAGDSVTVRFTAAGESGSFGLSPATDTVGEAVLTWVGPPFGDGIGRVALIDEAGGWRLYSISVGKKGASFAPEDAAKTFAGPGG
jgi:hypothetical protein